jgi:hypothetical protein
MTGSWPLIEGSIDLRDAAILGAELADQAVVAGLEDA